MPSIQLLPGQVQDLAKSRGKSILIVTHDHDLIDETATRIWHFDKNGIEDFQGPYEEFQRSRNAMTYA